MRSISITRAEDLQVRAEEILFTLLGSARTDWERGKTYWRCNGVTLKNE